MSLLFPEEKVRNLAAKEVWESKEVDVLLNEYFEGTDLGRIAAKLKRNRHAIVRKLQEFIYNERNRTVDYTPKNRINRKGMRITSNEKQLIEQCKKKGVDSEHIARVLVRPLEEVNPEKASRKAETELSLKQATTPQAEWHSQLKKATTSVDLILAYRYLYYVQAFSLVTDKEYDDLEHEEYEYGNGKGILDKFPGSDRAEDYPPHIRALGLYLAFKYTEREKSKRVYTCGEQKKKEVRMWYGPVPDFRECLAQRGKSGLSVLVRFEGEQSKIIRYWNGKKWVKAEDR